MKSFTVSSFILMICTGARNLSASAFVLPVQKLRTIPYLSLRYETNINDPEVDLRSARGGGIANLRYSEFLQMVQDNQLEKVTFSSSGDQLLGIAKNGMRVKLDALPEYPKLLSQLTDHNVDITVIPVEETMHFAENLLSLIFPFGKF